VLEAWIKQESACLASANPSTTKKTFLVLRNTRFLCPGYSDPGQRSMPGAQVTFPPRAPVWWVGHPGRQKRARSGCQDAGRRWWRQDGPGSPGCRSSWHHWHRCVPEQVHITCGQGRRRRASHHNSVQFWSPRYVNIYPAKQKMRYRAYILIHSVPWTMTLNCPSGLDMLRRIALDLSHLGSGHSSAIY
jgi:hypothetical protein